MEMQGFTFPLRAGDLRFSLSLAKDKTLLSYIIFVLPYNIMEM